jgi:hypothetical protein
LLFAGSCFGISKLSPPYRIENDWLFKIIWYNV